MKRRSFLRSLGMTVVATAATPLIFAQDNQQEVMNSIHDQFKEGRPARVFSRGVVTNVSDTCVKIELYRAFEEFEQGKRYTFMVSGKEFIKGGCSISEDTRLHYHYHGSAIGKKTIMLDTAEGIRSGDLIVITIIRHR